MKILLSTILTLLSIGLHAQWSELPITDVFGDKTGESIPYVKTQGTYSDTDKAKNNLQVTVFYINGSFLKILLSDHDRSDLVDGEELEYEKESIIYFKGRDGKASKSMSCPYFPEDNKYGIIASKEQVKKMLDGGRFLLESSNGKEYRFTTPQYTGEEQHYSEELEIVTETGNFDGSGDGVFGRKVIYRNHAELAAVTASGSGKIYVKVCISNDGKVTYCEIDNSNTTIKTKAILKKALKLIKSYRFEPDITAPKEQCGMIKLFLDINTFR